MPASWSHAMVAAAQGLEAARGRTGVLVGGRATWEDAYAYAKFARIVLDTNDVDFRARPHSAEEADFLAARVAGRARTVSYSDLESAPAVVLVGFEPEDESPIVFLRLRKAARKHKVPVYAIAPFATRGLQKMSGTLITTVPGAEPAALDGLATGEVGDLLATPGAVIMVGERLATVPGGLSAAARLADSTGAQLAWIPRRAGERGALEAGALPGLLPGGRPLADETARSQVREAWHVAELPTAPGHDADGMLAAAADGTLGALLVGGVEPGDFADPDAVLAALDAAGFVVSLELRHSAVTERADVVFPVAPTAQKAGAFVNWEGRYRGFKPALHGTTAQAGQSDHRVLDALADEMGVYLGVSTVEAARAELAALGTWDGKRAAGPHNSAASSAPGPAEPGAGEAILTGWRMLLDAGRLQDGEPHLAGTARPPLVRLSAGTAAEIGADDGDEVTVSTARGSITLPLKVTDMPDRVVWLPLNSPGSAVHRQLGATQGSVVRIGVSE
ncbi:molybdopterin dinucleotide binding domain protein [Mycobacterium kansasii]|uniref:Molybdopterin dinucleotide binding domain protein n=1 Tax=Mycobacterium kansasii TaxID=1768 RepID=A0A1V3XV98_MYCKA|nr:molybdopterin dinucleotide binding domain protein [Mycobacterium kansasii]